MNREFWKMAANRHPGLVPNMAVNAPVSLPLYSSTTQWGHGICQTPTVPFMTDLGTGVSPGLKVEFINRSRRGNVKKAKVVKMRQG